MFSKLSGSGRRYTALATALALCASSVALADEDYSRTVPAEPDGQVEISMFGGYVEVTGWDQPQVEVKGSLSGSVERVDVTSDHSRTSIRVQGRHGSEATLQVRVPKGSEIEITTVSADMRVSNVQNEQRLKSVSGSIESHLYGKDVETKTVSGNTTLTGERKPISVRATSVSGDIHYDRGAGDLEGSTVSGSLNASLNPGQDIRVRTTSGDVGLEGRLGNGASVEGEAISGELRVEMKSEGFRYEVNSFSGDIGNCFKVEAERTSKYGPGSRLQGSTGNGKGEVRLKTLSGDIQICDD